ncbi:RNA polymerase sigma factor [Marinifilum sp. RC60d5]|uniref:RNA polymerase sigma factor n=1 Tax=Marinifilum sp. RC60d5 TaxID=3458414 RepID=UPI004035BF40
MPTDYSILEAIKKDNKKGLDNLFERYYKPLVLFANAYLNDIHLSEDIVQEQFIKFWNDELYNNIQTSKALSSYLFTLVKHASLNQIKKNDVLANTAEFTHYDIAEEEAKRLADEGIKKVHNALADLPEKTRKVVECIMIQNMRYKEAAEELEVSVNTIKTLLRGGLAKLKESLKDRQDLFILFFMK